MSGMPKDHVQSDPIIVRRYSRRARRMTLKIDATEGVAELVVPPGVSDAESDRFERKHRR